MRLYRFCLPLFALFIFVYIGCSPAANRTQPVSRNSSSEPAAAPRLWQPSDTLVCVVFGPGCNDPETVSQTRSLLAEQVGLEEGGGLVRPLVYPDDFLNSSGVPRISRLEDFVSQGVVTALVFMGNPAGSSRTLAAIRESHADMPIVSVFPQDDPISAEAVSSFVLDTAVPEDLLTEEVQFVAPARIASLTLSLVSDAANKNASDYDLPPEELRAAAARAAGTDWSAEYFVDPDTGIRSCNHFIITERTGL